MKAKLYDFGLHRHKDEYKTQVLGYRNVVLDKKERLRLILNGGFGRENPAKKLSLIQICEFFVILLMVQKSHSQPPGLVLKS